MWCKFWSPHHAKDIAKLAAVQRRVTKMIPSLRNESFEERLARLNLFSLEKRRLRVKLSIFKILIGFTNVNADKMFSIVDLSRTRRNGIILSCRRQIELDCTKLFFTYDDVREWNKLAPSAVQSNTINSFKNKFEHHLLR